MRIAAIMAAADDDDSDVLESRSSQPAIQPTESDREEEEGSVKTES